MKKRVICVDFDGVIHRYSKGWQDGLIYDPPIKGAREVLEKLVSRGFRIIILTTRLNPKVNEDIDFERNKMTKWFIDNGFKPGVHYHDITAVKPNAEIYIDDKGIRFTSWQDVLKHFL